MNEPETVFYEFWASHRRPLSIATVSHSKLLYVMANTKSKQFFFVLLFWEDNKMILYYVQKFQHALTRRSYKISVFCLSNIFKHSLTKKSLWQLISTIMVKLNSYCYIYASYRSNSLILFTICVSFAWCLGGEDQSTLTCTYICIHSGHFAPF